MISGNISLIGFMGSGKTTIGRMLAEKLGVLFIDIDRIIEIAEGKSINRIFKEHGEKYFRKIETGIIKKIYYNNNCIFACGGGVINKKENMDFIKKRSRVVYLKISTARAFERLKDAEDRPVLKNENRKENIQKLLGKRDGLYKKYADITIENSCCSPEETTERIIKEVTID